MGRDPATQKQSPRVLPTAQGRRPALLYEVLQAAVVFVQQPENMGRIDAYILSPLFKHVFNKLFPYLLLTGVMFFLLFVMLTLLLALVLRGRSPGTVIPTAMFYGTAGA